MSGSLLVTLVAARLADVSAEPYNMSYVHDVVFGPFPSMRHFWEYVLGGAVIIRPYYIHWRWLTLPRTGAQYCNTGSAFGNITIDVLNTLYNTAGIRLPDRSYLIIVLNAQPPVTALLLAWLQQNITSGLPYTAECVWRLLSITTMQIG